MATRASDGLRLGIAHHYGWAVAVTATADHEVVDRRRMELLGPGLPATPIHHESRADSVMYRQVLADLAAERGWAVHRFDGRTVEADARAFLGDRADEVLLGPRARLGAPWSKDHRIALAATVTI